MEVSASDIRNRFLEDGRLLPWSQVNYTTWFNLANKLDLPNPVSNNDWRGLAEHLGFSTEEILLLESNGAERKTITLFRNFMHQADATVNKVARALKQMDRNDALKILLDAVPDIEERFLAQQNAPGGLEPVETDDHCMGAQAGCRCLGSPTSLQLGSQHRSGGCSSCHTHSHCNYMTGGCCCRSHVPSHHSHNCRNPLLLAISHRGHSPVTPHPHLVSSSMTTTAIHPSNVMMSASLNPLVHATTCTVNSKGGCLHKYNIAPGGGVPHENGSGQNNTHMAEGGLYGPESLPLHNQHMSTQQQHSYHRQLSENGGQSVDARSRVQPDSMAVQPDTCHERAMQSFSSDAMEIDRGQREEPAPLPNAIARGQGCLMSGPDVLRMDVSNDDEPSTTTEELLSSDSLSSLHHNGGGQFNIMRQVSEECNAKQPYSAGPPTYNRGNVSPSGKQWSRGEGGERGGYGKEMGDRGASLHHLRKLSELPDRYMPDEKYTTMVAKQQMDNSSPTNSKRPPFPATTKRERSDLSGPCCYPSSESTDNSTTSSRSAGSSGSRSRGGENPHTFPMRVKPQSVGSMMEDVRRLQPGQLTKTTSVPIDMKMEEFRKAFRHIKVFVTYANDSKQHSKQVLSLCNCLDRNGFSCCVDVYSRHEDSSEQQQASREWCARKFKEADFILVCISPQYLREIEISDTSPTAQINGSSSSGLLHAAYIYQLMLDEYQVSGRCTRFVPLSFEGSCKGQGPGWLTGQLVYHWPRQYKDLLWMLTKPEERIKQRPKTGSRNHSSASMNGHRSALSSVH